MLSFEVYIYALLLDTCSLLIVLVAVSTFGKFPEETMLSIHTRILVHLSQTSQHAHNAVQNGQNGHQQRRGSNHSPLRMMGGKGAGADNDTMVGMDHDTSDILAAEPRRKGGLMRSGGDVSWQDERRTFN